MINVKQCCYTRTKSGFKIINSSVNDSDVTEAYERIQTQNIPMIPEAISGTMDITELIGNTENQCLFFSKIRVGLTDDLGRRGNIFSHGFIFQTSKNNIYHDPNIFLTISNSNFKIGEDRWNESGESLELVYELPYKLVQALDKNRLIQPIYCLLIHGVHAQQSSELRSPLYIYDSSERGIDFRALMYCIYSGIPLFMRPCLSSTTYLVNTEVLRDIVIGKPEDDSKQFFDIATGENNILLPEIIEKQRNLKFVDYFANNFMNEDLTDYFHTLDKKAKELGDFSASNRTLLKAAHVQIVGENHNEELSDNELRTELNKLVKTSNDSNAALDDAISKFFTAIVDRGIVLNDVVENNLFSYLDLTDSQELIYLGERYKVNRLLNLDIKEAAERLSKMSETWLVKTHSILEDKTEGIEILDEYYQAYYLSDNISWESLKYALIKATGEIPLFKTKEKVESEANELYLKELVQNCAPIDSFNSYVGLMRLTIPEKRLRQFKDEQKAVYWEYFSFKNFSDSEQSRGTYHFFEISDKKCNQVIELLEILDRITEIEVISEELNSFFVKILYYLDEFPENEKQLVENIITRKMEEILAKGLIEANVFEWYRIAKALNSEVNLDSVFTSYQYLKNYRSEDFLISYKNWLEGFNIEEIKKNQGIEYVNQFFLEEINNYFRSAPLDVWLILGSVKWSNPFYIFDNVSKANRVLNKQHIENYYQRKDSVNLFDDYVSEAKLYVKERGNSAKLVQAWINENNRRSKENKNILEENEVTRKEIKKKKGKRFWFF